jgi:hypothetical protein
MACISSAKNFNCIWIAITNFSQEVAALQSFLNDSLQKQIRIPLMQAPSWRGHWKNLKLLEVYQQEPTAYQENSNLITYYAGKLLHWQVLEKLLNI